MEEWRFEPAHDFGFSLEQRRLSLRREVGLESAISCFLWRFITRFYLALAHRLKIRDRTNLPARSPFILVANHASHLDAIILGAILPLRFVGTVFPIAAGDTFFTKRVADLAEKLRGAFAGGVARTIAERPLGLHFISGRNAHTNRCDCEVQARTRTFSGGNKRSSRTVSFARNLCCITCIRHSAALAENFGDDWHPIIV
jgi:hypothetical protein